MRDGMARILVAFESRYGSTGQYAEWIGQALGADVLRARDVKPASLANYDSVVVGGYLRMGRIRGSEFVVRNWAALKGKPNLVFFTCSATPPEDPKMEAYFKGAFPEEIRQKVKYFPLPGRVGKLGLFDSILMLFPKIAVRLGAAGKGNAKESLEMLNGFDHVDRSRIDPIIKALL
jgi:menaquinone-dependent protoporphyrinogen IX oxidase